MVDLSSLKNLFDISIDLDVRNVALVNIEGRDKLSKEGKTLKVNVRELEGPEREEVIELTQDHFEEEQRVLGSDELEDATALESSPSDDIQDALDYFDGLISDHYLEMVKMGLNLRKVIDQRDLGREAIRRRKREIANKKGANAIYVASLCTAGYFDENGGLRDLYVEMRLNDDHNAHRFNREFEQLIENELLCVFVESDETVYEVTQEARGRIARYQRKDPIHDWLDLRGIGDGCEELINGAMANLEEEFIGFDYDRWNEGERSIIRIYPHTIPNLPS